MFCRDYTSGKVTKGNSALLMICGYITGLKAGAEFKCSSNISFYLYPQTLAEINELRQVRGDDVTNNFFLTPGNEYAQDILLFHCQLLTGRPGSAAGGLLKRFNVGINGKVVVSLS